MNPNGAITPLQQKNARRQYLSNLQLEQANIAYNTNANMIYKETKQITKPIDTRSVEQKLADIQSLKQYVREALSFTKNSSDLVNQLDNTELQYVAQNINRIISEINNNYSLGIPAGVFSTLVRNLKSKDSIQQQIQSGIQENPELFSMTEIVSQFRELHQSLKSLIDLLKQSGIPNSALSKVNTIAEQFNPSKVNEKTAQNMTPEMISDLENKQSDIQNAIGVLQADPSKNNATSITKELVEQFYTPMKSPEPAVVEDDDEISLEDLKEKYIVLGGKKQGLHNIKRETLIRKIDELQQQKKAPKLTDKPQKSPDLITELKEKLKQRTPSGTGVKKKSKNIIMGCGLAKPKVKVTPDNIDTTLGIPPVKSYVSLGRYLLNKTKLNDNILMMKHIKGGAIGQLPTIHISNKLVSVLKHLITSQLPPDFDTLTNLDDKEKKLLHKIAKSTQILERFSIPNPNLTKEEQELNRFEILRGEMNAGNDSKELIKEFKILLLRMINNGKIPRREGQDILTDLIAMGY